MRIMLYKTSFLIFLFVLGSCGTKGTPEKPSRETLKEKIKQMEDSLKTLHANIDQIKQIPNLTHFELINRLLDYYHHYPEDTYAAECLDKVHMKYSGMNISERAVQYADTLLKKYPEYVNRNLVIESQIGAYDVSIKPRDTTKIRYYYNLLLKENPNMPKDKKSEIMDRLGHLEMNLFEYIDFKMKSVEIPN